ncbi:MAG TPA: T9SS type A sorting domain-containing protein, partial [candidate division Zixibacteria bacterium]|nr:T9SS type A sorting domain-containing protein [candidate division Zixibacteria bacterium]
HILDSSFAELDGFPVNLGFAPQAPPVLSDLDQDGYLDVLVVGDSKLAVYSRQGTLLPNFPVPIGPLDNPDGALVPPIVGDWGGQEQLVAVTGGESRAVYGINADGTRALQLPRALGAALIAPAAWAMNTGVNEAAVFARSDDGYLYGYQVPPLTENARNAIWPMAGRNAQNQRTVPSEDLDPLNVDSRFFVEERAFVYPNPASTEAIVRYWLGADAEVTIEIYDRAGNRVSEWQGPGHGGVYNEWTWQGGSAASGVYFARLSVTAADGGASETVFCKLAVVQ